LIVWVHRIPRRQRRRPDRQRRLAAARPSTPPAAPAVLRAARMHSRKPWHCWNPWWKRRGSRLRRWPAG